jgi:hypothetical protein
MFRITLRIAPLLCLAVVANAARAEEHSWDIGAGASEAQFDPTLDTDRSSLFATYFFDPVDDGSGPYALATFFDPGARLSLGVAREKQTLKASGLLPPGSMFGPEHDEYSLDGRYVLRESRWYFGGRYERDDPDDSFFAFPADIEGESYGFVVGQYIGTKTSLELTADGSKHTFDQSLVPTCLAGAPCLPLQLSSRTTSDILGLAALHVRRFRGLTYALSGGVSETTGEFASRISLLPGTALPPNSLPNLDAFSAEGSLGRVRAYSAGAELFPTAKFGVRVGYSAFDGDARFADDAYDVGATWFITHHVGLRFGYSRTSARDDFPSGSTDTATMSVTGRF